VTAVRLQGAPARCSIAFGSFVDFESTDRGKLALFGPRKIVAYAVKYSPCQALYLFRTPPTTAETGTRLRGVSTPVNLLYVATTRRTADKTLAALKELRRRVGDPGIDALPDIFWLRLSDFIDRRGQKILYFVTQLLARQATP
jgi:hypothetical protein